MASKCLKSRFVEEPERFREGQFPLLRHPGKLTGSCHS